MFLLSLSGCGYKGAPYYVDETAPSDPNVEFIIKKSSEENNESTKSR
jgi:predicted small lipoprotein YifL